MINPNSGVINDGWTRPTDESVEDDISPRHVLITPETCDCDKESDSLCNVCDGGLAICSICNKAEAELDGPCEIAMVDADCGHRVPASQVRSGFVGVTFPMEYSACHDCRHGKDCEDCDD